MFADHLAFVDVETTGTSPHAARITEIGMISVRADGAGGWQVEEWSSLVNPGCAIPPEIQYLTGIRPDMVANAPTFADLAPQLHERLNGAIFVAHNARFDYGFIKTELARTGVAFTAKTLCTVRLSRLLDPDRSPHSLDAVIARHRLAVADRHRALGDARALWLFVQKVWLTHGSDVVLAAARRLLRHPSLPSHLPPDTLEKIPRSAGVYQFLGLNDHPLYIGKSTCLRERVASHFVSDYRHERGIRLASEVRRIDWQSTAGDLGAQLLEGAWIRERLPAHNIALRRKLLEVVIEPFGAATDASRQRVRLRKLSEVDHARLPGHYGPFASRAAARASLLQWARESGVCAKVMGLERGAAGAPCFNRQLGRCQGACVGAEPLAPMFERLAQSLAPLAIPAWTLGPLAVCETDDERAIEDWHVFDQWLYLGCAHDRQQATRLLDAAPSDRVRFDTQAYRLLRKVLYEPAGLQIRLLDRGTLERPPADRAMEVAADVAAADVASDVAAAEVASDVALEVLAEVPAEFATEFAKELTVDLQCPASVG